MKRASDNTRGHLTVAQIALREKQTAKAFALGEPQAPDYLWNKRPLWAAWKKCAKQLLEKRLLAFCDGPELLELSEATVAGDSVRVKKIFQQTWAAREPFTDGVQINTLAGLLATVQRERATFSDRMRPTQTLTLDDGGKEYSWPEGDAAEDARRYCLEVVAGTIVTGELLQRAAARFLKYLDEGYKRGIYLDPMAARSVVTFARQFCGLANLMPWQTWALVSIFGFKKASGARLVSEAWVSMGRKNGKTALASTVGLFLMLMDCERYPEIYAASCAKEQSRICWKDARRAVGDNPELAVCVQRYAGELAVKETDASFKPLASEEKSFLGTRPHGVIADEVAAWSDRLAWDTLVQGTVSREQPLTLAITTAGESKLSFGFEKFSWAEKILRGMVDADHVFAAIYQIDSTDSPTDLAALRKSNPSLNVTLREEHLQKQITEIEENPTALNNFIRFHANIYPELTLTRQNTIKAGKWDACAGLDLVGATTTKDACERFMSLNSDEPCFGGLDVGMVSDMSAFVTLWPRSRFAVNQEPTNEKLVCLVQFFMPEEQLLKKEKTWGVPLSHWVRQGWIQLCSGDMQDPNEIRKVIVEACSLLRVRELGFDRWNAEVLCAQLSESGCVQCVAVPQVPSQLTTPAKELLQAINQKKLVHFGNPVLSWHATNVLLTEDATHGGIKPLKISENEKIDGVAALLNAWNRMLANPITSTPRMTFIWDDGSAKTSGPDGHLHDLSTNRKE